MIATLCALMCALGGVLGDQRKGTRAESHHARLVTHLKLPESMTAMKGDRLERSKRVMDRFTHCMQDTTASDCIRLIVPCVPVLQQLSSSGGVHLGEANVCPLLLRSKLSSRQIAVMARRTLGVESYFEWGSGGTSESVGPFAQRSYSAEHYSLWCTCVQYRPLNRCLAKLQREVQRNGTNLTDEQQYQYEPDLGNRTAKGGEFGFDGRIVCVDTGIPLRTFGRPANDIRRKSMLRAHNTYVDAIDQPGESTFDVILVDGRARVSCALKAIGYTHKDSVIFVTGWPHKFLIRHIQFFDIVRVWDRDGSDKCDNTAAADCVAMLRPKREFIGLRRAYPDHTKLYPNFASSPVNF